MKLTLRDKSMAPGGRRGVTLVEMLVTLAILLLMMTAVVQIFQAATGSLNSAQVYQQLDNQLRQLDVTIRSDLNGVTAKMTPPNNPANDTGYFEYGENEFADNQGEDGDDYIRFTAKAPAGRPFTGRAWVYSLYTPTNQLPQPITITSEYAEVIYFLRNGNLYRRVLLVAPERQSSLPPTMNNQNPDLNSPGFFPIALGGNPLNFTGNRVSWQGVNDLSARPVSRGRPSHLQSGAGAAPLLNTAVRLNTLGDLSNRENRFAYQRFADDFFGDLGYPDGLPDDANLDAVPDFYPTMYPTVQDARDPANQPIQLIYEPVALNRAPLINLMAFPFVYPGAYSQPQFLSNAAYGWIHSPSPQVNIGDPYAPVPVPFEGNANGTTLDYLNHLNHNPIDAGDNLSLPASQDGFLQTWWGFPTWRETISPSWTDPTYPVSGVNYPKFGLNLPARQPFGLRYQNATVAIDVDDAELLPAMTAAYRLNPQPYTDTYGRNSGFFSPNAPLWSTASWEDDLIMTGVRSFDVKAYDESRADFVDLGWGDDYRQYVPYSNFNGSLFPNPATPALASTPPVTFWPPLNPNLDPRARAFDTLSQTFAHEGRMPPLVTDMRLDASNPNPTYNRTNGNFVPQYPDFASYSSNIGDNNPVVFRLRRVWDSWSTAYTQAPASGVFPNGFPAGPPFTPPVYPSYPPPYPAPLRGLQIQIRVVDPSNQRIKTLTIRQDFTDKL
ncbi:MAG: type II secretion system protein [Isosphaeraceae bacterium]